MRAEFNNLVELMNRYDLYQKDDEVGIALSELEQKITEVEKRLVCIDETAKEIHKSISKYTESVDKPEPFIMGVNDHDNIQRGSNDIMIACDLSDDEPIINNWYQLFEEPKEEVSSGGIPYRYCHHCSIKEEETVMGQVNGFWLCCDCHDEIKDDEEENVTRETLEEPPTSLCKTPQTHEFVKDIIAKLKVIDVDGETMQYIIEQVGMNDQMLRQLIMSNPESDTKDLLDEKIELSNKSVRGCIEI